MTGLDNTHPQSLQQWAGRETTWTQRYPPELANIVPQSRGLGDPDALNEWEQEERPWELFTPIHAFKELQPAQILYLCGRRGTGKTALLRMLDRKVQQGTLPPYECSLVLSTQKLLLTIVLQLRCRALEDLSQYELAYVASTIWRWLLVVGGMAAAQDLPLAHASDDQDLDAIRSYLSFLPGNAGSSEVSEALNDEVERLLAEHLGGATAQTEVGAAVASLKRALFGNGYARAATALRELLSRRKSCSLVLVDSAEIYSPRDKNYIAALSGLLAAANEVFTRHKRDRVLAKVALPSELLPHVYVENAGKMQNRVVFIRWRFKDLISLLAKRFEYAYEEPIGRVEDAGQSFEKDREKVYRYLPRTVSTRLGNTWEGVSYVVRHTQKTPRQLILVLNAALAVAEQRSLEVLQLAAAPDVLVEGIHAGLNLLVDDALINYKPIYSFDVSLLVRRALTMMKSYFTDAELDERIKELSDLRASLDQSRTDVKRILFETGAMGVLSSVHPIRGDETKWVAQALFEYQVKDVQVPANQKIYVVHPMFTDALQTSVDDCAYVYPVPYEDEELVVLVEHGVPAESLTPCGKHS